MTPGYRALVFVVKSILGVFFRRIEVSGIENVPESSGGIIVAWHPNALVDAALIFTSCPGRVVFGARHGLFSWPIVGRIMKSIGAVPIYRAQDQPAGDDEARRLANQKSLNAMAEAVAGGAFTALFPEGMSHDEPSPQALKTGAARIYYQSVKESPAGQAPPVLIPVGLHYDEKQLFGSSVLIVYHPPLELEPSLRDPPPETATEDACRTQCRSLTEVIEQTLKNIVHATESWRVHQLLHRARKLVRAERGARAGAQLAKPDMAERVLAFSRLWIGYNELRRTHPREIKRLMRRIREYDGKLQALKIEDHELDAGPSQTSGKVLSLLVLQTLLVFLVLPPVLAFGYIVNLPPAFLVWLISKQRSKAEKDAATIKLLTGVVAFPLAWLIAAIVVTQALIAPNTSGASLGMVWLTGIATFVLSALAGLLTVHYQRFAIQTFRAIRLRLTYADDAATLNELLSERSALCDEVVRLARHLDLPGDVLPDGRVLDEASF